MNKNWILTLLLLLAACSPTQTAVVQPTVPSPNTPVSTVASVPVIATSTATNEPTSTITAIPEIMEGPSLQILSPLEDAMVNTSQVEVVGIAPAGTVISIGDEILLVGEDGQFRAIVMLEEGPNLIEIVASDAGGNERSTLLPITYEP